MQGLNGTDNCEIQDQTSPFLRPCVSENINILCGAFRFSIGRERNRGSYMSAHYISFFMKRVYLNDMTRALASVIFIIVNEFRKNDM